MAIYTTKLQKVLLWSIVISFTVFLLLSSFYLFLYNPRFYNHQYAKNGVYTVFGYNETWNVTKELWRYMKFQGEFTSSFYSERDQLHMIDVRNILVAVQRVFYVSIIVFLIGLLYHYAFSRESFPLFLYDIFYSTSIFTAVLLFLFVLLALFFDNSFFLFHISFFSNNYWLMDPTTDKLVLLFPQQFFLTILLSILGVTLLFAIVVFCICLYVKKRYL